MDYPESFPAISLHPPRPPAARDGYKIKLIAFSREYLNAACQGCREGLLVGLKKAYRFYHKKQVRQENLRGLAAALPARFRTTGIYSKYGGMETRDRGEISFDFRFRHVI